MKVKFEDGYRSTYTLEDLDQAKAVIQYEKENDCDTAKGWAEMAAREALKDTSDRAEEVLKADARTARNSRAWDAYGDGTGHADVWIEATVKTGEGFLIIGAYLSDIWQTGAEDYREHMYIEKYGRI